MKLVRKGTMILLFVCLALMVSPDEGMSMPAPALPTETSQLQQQEPLVHEVRDRRSRLRGFFRRLRKRAPFARRLWRWRRGPYVFRKLLKRKDHAKRGCLSPRKIHRRLRSQGWWDFRRLSVTGKAFRLQARHPSGSVYSLRVDRCTGRVLGASRLRGGPRPNRLLPR